jgi:acetyl esterase/lipase
MTPTPFRCLLALLGVGACLGAEAPIRLWPGIAPGDKPGMAPEADKNTAKSALVAGRRIMNLGDVSEPTLTVFKPPADKDTGAAVVVCPGGGYWILAYDLEGTEVCAWLNSIGVTGVLLKYRVPQREGLPPYTAALQDAQRAIGLVREHAKDWGIDPKRVGALGFSAGGNLCAVLSASGARTYPRVDAADDLSCRPDFQVLIYPAYLVKDGGYAGNAESAVTSATPPTFLVMAQDDPVHVENILGYALQLQAAKVPMEVHLYPTGGHGYGLRPTKDFVTTWPQRAADWMTSRGLLEHN